MLREKVKGIKCKIMLAENGQVPTKASEESACYDMFARDIEYTDDPNLVKVSLGVHLEPQPGYRVAIYPRSGINKTGWMLVNSVGVGDNDYRGEYMAYFRRINPELVRIPIIGTLAIESKTDIKPEFPYKRGERCCQMELVEYRSISWEIVDELSKTKRDAGGFGSSGK